MIGTIKEKEIIIIHCLADGLGTKQMPERTGFTQSTCESYVLRIRRKFRAANAAHLVSIAYQRGILTIKP